MGYARAFKYTKLRLARIADTSHKIALGLALGLGISFTPIIGTHIIQAAILSFILRGNILASTIGTLIGNPATFPFMWGSAILLGSYIFDLCGFEASATVPEVMSLENVWQLIKSDPFRIFLPWALGGYILAFAAIPLTYPVFLTAIKGFKLAQCSARKTICTRQARKLAIEITSQKD